MSVTLRQIKATIQRLDLRELLPRELHARDTADIGRQSLALGKHRVPLAELFDIERKDEDDDTLVLIPLDDRTDFVGHGLSEGRIIVRGDTGDYAGRAMSGGSLTIEGDARDFAGSGLGGGRLIINGNAGDRVGAPGAGERHGQHGGFIHIRGNAGARAGERQRRGVLLIEGNTGDLLGYRMIAGTIYAGGDVGELAGYGMRRGSLFLRQTPEHLCSTIRYNGRHLLTFVRLQLNELHRLSNGAVANTGEHLEVERYLGDLANDGRGEILVLNGSPSAAVDAGSRPTLPTA